MKSLLVVSVLSVISFSSFAQTLKCLGTTADQKARVEAIVDDKKEAHVKIIYNDSSYVNEQFLTFEEGVYFYAYGDSCSNQITGLEEYTLTRKDNAATLHFSWCDDDGGSGYEIYDLTCSELK